MARLFSHSDPVQDLKLFHYITPDLLKGTTGCNRQCLPSAAGVMTSISTHINWYKSNVIVVTRWLFHGSHFQIVFFFWVIATTITFYDLNKYRNDLYPLHRMYRKMESHEDLFLHFLNSSRSHQDHLVPKLLNNYSVNAINQLLWQSWYTVCSFIPLTTHPSTTVDVSLSFSLSLCLSSSLSDRRGQVMLRGEEGLKCCWAPSWATVQAQGEARKMWAAYQLAVTGRLLLRLC